MYLCIEVKEAMWTVDIVKRSKACDGSVNIHRVSVHASSATQEYPVRVGPTHKHLQEHACWRQQHQVLSEVGLNGLSRNYNITTCRGNSYICNVWWFHYSLLCSQLCWRRLWVWERTLDSLLHPPQMLKLRKKATIGSSLILTYTESDTCMHMYTYYLDGLVACQVCVSSDHEE